MPNQAVNAIYNGEPADGSQFVVAVRTGTACSGTMVRPQILATAGHCVIKNGERVDPESIRVWAPGVNRSTTSHVANGVALFVPSDYFGSENGTVRPKDIAFVVLNRKIPGTVDLLLADYEFTQFLIQFGSEIRLYGYGRISQTQTTSTPYSMIGYPIEQEESRSFIGFERFYMNYDASEEGSTCPGDSGGPAISRYGDNFVLVSIHSGSRGPCSRDPDGGPWKITSTIAGEFQFLLEEATMFIQNNRSGPSQNLVLDISSGEATLSWDPPNENLFAIEGYTVIDGQSGLEFCKTVQTICSVKVVPGPNVFVVFAETAANRPDAVFSFEFVVPPVDSISISAKNDIGYISWSISEELEELISGFLVTDSDGNEICKVVEKSCSSKLNKGNNFFRVYTLYGDYRSAGLDVNYELKTSKRTSNLTCANGKMTKTPNKKNSKCPKGLRKI